MRPGCAIGLAGLVPAAAALLTAAPAFAQGWQCRPPVTLPRSEAAPRASNEPVRRVALGGYTLALIWSPEYCRLRQSSARDALQCSAARIGDFGFTLHGLWPEGRGQALWPQYCRSVDAVPPKTLRANICRTPSVSLMNHEWARHGSCMTRTPGAYFRASRVLFDALIFPDMDRLSRSEPTAAAVRGAIADANPGLAADAVRLQLNERGWLTEVRLCLGLKFRAAACPTRSLKDETPVKIWRGG
ncbi:ribonuclease T2 family protein [Novosphingopyxis sp.]|uniref:ribonuclease T2 family protein n=1 Tax=Novosphingopyxis sp. TaxID=2709690 RepID=UPI003B590E95